MWTGRHLADITGAVVVESYIGQIDIDSQKIFNGDKLRNKDTTYTVKWNATRFCFDVRGIPDRFSHVQAISVSSQFKDIKRIGTVHDDESEVNDE